MWVARANAGAAPFARKWGVSPSCVLEHDGDARGRHHRLIVGEWALPTFRRAVDDRGDHVIERARTTERESLPELDAERRQAVAHAVRFHELRHRGDAHRIGEL